TPSHHWRGIFRPSLSVSLSLIYSISPPISLHLSLSLSLHSLSLSFSLSISLSLSLLSLFSSHSQRLPRPVRQPPPHRPPRPAEAVRCRARTNSSLSVYLPHSVSFQALCSLSL